MRSSVENLRRQEHEMQSPLPIDEQLPGLKPSVLLPERYSERAQVITWLKRVEYVAVRESSTRDGTKYYMVDVFMKLSQNRIPSNCATNLESIGSTRREESHRAAVSTERRFSEFSSLLSRCFDTAHRSHGFIPCNFCMGLLDFVLVGNAAPSVLHKWFCHEATVLELLTRFVNAMLHLSRRVKTYSSSSCQCDGQKLVPEIVQQFLNPRSVNIVHVEARRATDNE